jgi:phosphatidylserine/phosphatidylglycerophosphate/cardiolipin synthase-like enzyme
VFHKRCSSRATASTNAPTECYRRTSSNLQARKPVPSRLVIYLLLGLLLFCPPYVLAADIAVCFTPEYGTTPSCTQEVVDALTGAKKSVLVQAYGFTSAPIAKALVDAHRRGVEVKVILDRSNRTAHYSAATFLAHAGIPVWIDARHAIAHNKIMIIDGNTILTGSFNFTKAAEQENAENILTIHDSALAGQYTGLGSNGTENRLKSLSGKVTRKKMSQIKHIFPDRLSVSEAAA